MPRERAEPELMRMLATSARQASDTTGAWFNHSLGVYVAWTARKQSFADRMPLYNEKGDLILIFSGEEFPEPETVRTLQRRGHTLNPDGPSYLVHLCEEDAAFPAGLNGRFHGIFVDQKRKAATLFNDRYGMHRIYYHESADAFYFSAQAKSILEVCPELRRMDPRSFGELVACGCVMENRTIFAGIHVLPPAAAWSFRSGSIEHKNTYFHPREWENQTPLDPESYYEQIRDIFSRNISRYFKGPEQIGMSLTGGLDSRMIMAWQKCPPGTLPCYSFGGMFRDCQDVVIARKVAQACGQSHEVIQAGQEFLSRFPQYAERTVYLAEGCTDVSHSPDLYVNEHAAAIAPVRMTGNYGGEVLRRVRAFKPVEPPFGLFAPEFVSYVHAAKDTYKGLLHTHPLSFAVFRQAPWHHYGLLALEQTQVSLRSPYLDNDLVRTVFRAPQSSLADNNVCLRLIADGNPALRRIETDRGLAGKKGNIAAAASRRLIDFSVKAEYAYDYGMPQWLAPIDRILSPLHLERIFLGRHKFYHFRIWYRNTLSEHIREVLLDSRTLSRTYLQRNWLEIMVRDHVNGKRNYTSAIHKVLTLELLHRLLIESR